MRTAIQIAATILYKEDEEGRQIGYEHNLFAVADDGTVWLLRGAPAEWVKLPDLPQDEPGEPRI